MPIEVRRMKNVKVKVLRVVAGEIIRVPGSVQDYLEDIAAKQSGKEMQNTTILKTNVETYFI